MIRNTNTASTHDEEGRHPRRLGLACTTLLPAVVVGSLAGWQVHEHGRVRPIQPIRAIEATAAPVDQPLVREVPAAHYLYLVSSEEAAARLWFMLSEGLSHRYQTGERQMTVTVLGAAELTSLQPDQQVVDLRRW